MPRIIHPTAIVDDGATVGHADIGPFSVVGPGVTIADGVRVGPHCVLQGKLSIGTGTVLTAHVVLGGDPQDLKHDPAVETELIIGENNTFREFSSAHRGSSGGGKITRIGNGNYFMANSHVAHDCTVGDGTMFANSSAIGGHVEVQDGAILGGLCGIHQNCRIGRLSMVGGGAMCAQDVPPFTMAQGDRARIYGLNIIGLRRAGATDDTISALKDAWRTLFVGGLPRRVALGHVADAHPESAEVKELIDFMLSADRGVCRAGLRA